jgi:S1-C subfamily serine protease
MDPIFPPAGTLPEAGGGEPPTEPVPIPGPPTGPGDGAAATPSWSWPPPGAWMPPGSRLAPPAPQPHPGRPEYDPQAEQPPSGQPAYPPYGAPYGAPGYGGAGYPPYGAGPNAGAPYGSQPGGGLGSGGGYPGGGGYRSPGPGYGSSGTGYGAPAGGGYRGSGGPGGPGGSYPGWDAWGGGSWGHQPAPGPSTSRPWVAAGVALALFIAAVLGFGLVSQLKGNSTAQGSPGVNTFFGAPPAPGTSALEAKVASKLDPGIVDIDTVLDYGLGSAAGTGIVLTSSGEVLTNNHVVEDATHIQVTLVSTGASYTGSVVGYDVADDVAVVQLKGASGLPTAAIGDASKVSVGDTVVALGNALGAGGTPSVAQGSVLALNRSITASDETGTNPSEQLSGLIETSAALEPGDSGGPLANASAKVIGMDTAASTNFRFDASAGTSYAIPINTALNIAKQIEAGHSSGNVHVGLPGFLGVEVETVSGGAGIVSVEPGAAADSAGLAPGDVITSAAGQTISSSSDLTSVLEQRRPGEQVTITWTDPSGQSHSATVTLGSGPVP